MNSLLNILHLEDDSADADLVKGALDAGGVGSLITRVSDRDAFVAALEHGEIDLVLSDVALPTFDGLSALDLVRQRWPRLPLIFVSGTLGEEQAIDSFTRGATDYVLKGNLARLVPAVRRAMKDVEAEAERRRLEAQFIEAQKMEVIGQLASGVAHDFNNVITVITGACYLITMDLALESPLRELTEEIRHVSQRAAWLTKQLLIFSRNETVQPVILDLNRVMSDQDKMLRRLAGENIEITMQYGRDIGHINADPGYVGQVLMNLVVNARDAMPYGGKLTLTTENAMVDEVHAVTPGDMLPGRYIKLSIRDTGTGMTEEVKARIFQAFFTTKPKGKGTGLGLATCQTIVKQSGGYITVDSIVGTGTTFTVYFPCVEKPLDSVTNLDSHEWLPGGNETLLVVEDEPSVRHLTRELLEDRGYEVLTAINGQDGLRVLREHRGSPICLVITDVIMPEMGGKVMSEWLNITYPSIKILFTSGYTDDVIAHYGVLEPGVAFLPKPYSPSELMHSVREQLDTAPKVTSP